MRKSKVIAAGLAVLFVVIVGYLFVSNLSNSETAISDVTAETKVGLLASPKEKISEINVVSNDECSHLLDESKFTVEWAQNRLTEIQFLLRSTHIESDLIDYVSYKSGIGVLTGRLLSKDHSAVIKKPPFYSGETTYSSGLEDEIVARFIESGDSSELANAIADEKFRWNVFYSGSSHVVFLIGRIIESQDNAKELIPKLLNVGIKPIFSDLVLATRFGLPVETINDMYLASELDASEILYSFGYKTSLLTHAISSGNFEAAKFWLEQGSPNEPDRFSYTALDLLAQSDGNFTYEQKNELANELLSSKAKVNHPKTKEWLRSKLSSEQLSKFESLINSNHYFKLPSEQKQKADELIKELQIIALKNTDNEELLVNPTHPCLENISKKSLHYIIKNGRGQPDSKKTAEPQRKNKQITASANQEILQAEQLYTTKEDVESYLGKGKTIESKTLIEKYRLKKISESAQEIREKMGEEFKPTDLDTSIEKLNKLAQEGRKEGRWLEAKKLASELELSNSKILNLLLSLSLMNSAPEGFVLDLLQQGAELPKDAITRLIFKDNIDLAKMLVPYGLILNYIDILGSSTVINAVKFKASAMLVFLIQNGVDVNEYSNGFDALDFALRDFNVKTDKGFYVEALIKAGARIETSHKQWVEEKVDSDFESYAFLVSRYPELAP